MQNARAPEGLLATDVLSVAVCYSPAMRDTMPSRTAHLVALRRAAHQVLDEPLVLADPLALAIAGIEAAEVHRDPWHRSLSGRSLRAFLVARSRFAEDRLAEAVAAGVGQYVVLGAGLDTFALRNPFPRLRVFEVDHPATQQLKRQRLAAAGLAVPACLTFAAVDFTRQTLAEGLAAAGFDAGQPAFFSWLGVVPYLPHAAVVETLRFVASGATPVEIVLDYVIDPSLVPFLQRAALALLAARVAAAGEPFRTYLAPAALDAVARELGFEAIADLGAEELNPRYFHLRRDGLQLRGGLGRVAALRRDGTPPASRGAPHKGAQR